MSLPNSACIITGTNGFVWYAPRVSEQEGYITLNDARIIRVWGTTAGLAQLVTGPTDDTRLEAPSTVILAKSAFLFAIPCSTWSV